MAFIEPTLISLSNQIPQASPFVGLEQKFPQPTFLFSLRYFRCPTAVVQLPHNCGATASQLWCNCPTAVGQRESPQKKQRKAQTKPPEGQPSTTLVRLARCVFPQKNIGIRIIRRIRVHQKTNNSAAPRLFLPRTKRITQEHQSGHPSFKLVRLARFVFQNVIGIRIIRKIRGHQKANSSAAPRYFLPRTKRITQEHQSGHPSSKLVRLARFVFPQKHRLRIIRKIRGQKTTKKAIA